MEIDWALMRVIEGLEAFRLSNKAHSKTNDFTLKTPKFPEAKLFLSKPTKLARKV